MMEGAWVISDLFDLNTVSIGALDIDMFMVFINRGLDIDRGLK